MMPPRRTTEVDGQHWSRKLSGWMWMARVRGRSPFVVAKARVTWPEVNSGGAKRSYGSPNAGIRAPTTSSSRSSAPNDFEIEAVVQHENNFATESLDRQKVSTLLNMTGAWPGS